MTAKGRLLLRRDLLHRGAGLSGLALLSAMGSRLAHAATAPHAKPAPGPFDGSTVRKLAQKMATEPFQAPDTKLPGAVAHLNYDDFRGITYKRDQALWHDQKLPFQVQFFPRGFLYEARVDMFEVADGKATPVPYSPDLFDYANPKLRVPDNLGFSGLRILNPINKPDVFDEFCVFLGASYFRAVAKGQIYGLSARGLAIGTGNPKGEEFARFSAFWLERPQPGQSSLVLYALLDSQSVTGAFKFTITPGQETVFDVESAFFPRVDITEPGIATLTGMFYFDANNRNKVNDWRPAAHDSEGLQMWTGTGTQIWRPLNDPAQLQLSAFADTNPHGFGLMQRKRSFFDYQDVALQYEKRPSLWIEPIGDWGQGNVDLVEIPSPNEVNDNIVSFWRPKDKLAAHGEYNFTYRMHWGWDCPWPTKLGRIVDTRIGNSDDHQGLEVVLDIVGEGVRNLPADARMHAQLHASDGKIIDVVVEPNPATGGWRIMFTLQTGNAKLIELSGVLMNDQTPVSETWLYRWTP
ncbi:MAG TPA: glucan biosynthesis protein G [Acidisoma sp.]|uniref:glucan biosynthesis protein n=1 Tax=Acidisoma sp. TaxID=1872115 RepID=UPI002B67A3C3|nr:glucan biosynthesis protein G [Acidisoma sp.]HTH99664.1 glucan biosynthesis protein G [Acidisoma sp.]